MTEYTPTTEQVREDFATRMAPAHDATRRAGFDRWLEQVKREAKAEAVAEVATAFQFKAWVELTQGNLQDRLRIAQPITEWLHRRAAQYRKGTS